MVYVGSHAEEDEDGVMRMLPTDEGNDSPGITFDWLREQVALLPFKHILLLVDCCYSGALVRKQTYQERRWDSKSLTLVTSCGAAEVSECFASARRSPFASCVIETLATADPVDASHLARQVQIYVPLHEDQWPMVESRGEDFCI